MLVIGLTGSIGMGKSTAAARFRELGIAVCDADAEVHKLYEGKAVAPIEAAFPGSTANGKVDRQKLGQALIADPSRFARLEAIVHPMVKEAERQLQRIGMGELMHEQAGNLALGQQRLMEIARALAADPILLLLDEPAAGLRLKEKEGIADVLRQLRGEGLSILLVEHDMDLVMGLVDRVVVMEFGTKLIDGTPEVVQASPAVRAAYLGTEH